MAVLLTPRAVTLTATPFVSAPIDLPVQTATITLRLRLSTLALPLAWAATGLVGVALLVTIDGVTRRLVTGRVRGGLHSGVTGDPLTHYVLAVSPTWGFFAGRDQPPQRLGETRRTSYTVQVELTRLAGSVVTELEVSGTEAPAPAVAFHSSVAFDAATDAQEIAGDGVITISHTPAGSSNLAAFAGGGSFTGAGGLAGAATYDGAAMTELWDGLGSDADFSHAGYRLAGIPTGAKNVVNTLAGSPDFHAFGVVTFTGVDQTTPVGTAVTATGTVSPATVTVGSVGADDLVVDSVFIYSADVTPTIGADQTLRNSEDMAAVLAFRQSTQPDVAGDVMSWTINGGIAWLHGAVAFKPATGTAAGPLIGGKLVGDGILGGRLVA